MAKTIGRYEVREEIGRGGMAVVYLVHDPRLDRLAALKLMDQQLSIDPAFAARFEREAKTVAGLEHGAVVPLYDFGEADGWLYLVMRYMEGGTLKETIAKGPLTASQAYGVIRRIGVALDKAHSQGIIHRDLKPANILLDEEKEAYLSDFGIVKMAAGDTEYLTETGQTIGTFAYMSPEQVMGEKLDSRSDIYALGLVLYEMLAGSHPYKEAATSGAMAVAQAQRPVPDIRLINPALPPGCQAIIEKAMAKDPAERYGSGREMAMALYTLLRGETATQEPVAGTKATAVPRPDRAEVKPQRQQATSYAEVVKAESAQRQTTAPREREAAKQAAAPSAFPRWIIVLQGLLTLAAAFFILASTAGYSATVGFYWLLIGLLTAVSLLSRPADWLWRALVAALGVISFGLMFFRG